MARAMSGAVRSEARAVLAQPLVAEQEADRVEPGSDRGGIAQRARQPRSQLPRAGPRHRAIDDAEQARLALAGLRAQQLQARPRRRVDHQPVGRPCPPWRTQAGPLAELSQLDVLEERADGRQLRPREGTEGGEVADAAAAP